MENFYSRLSAFNKGGLKFVAVFIIYSLIALSFGRVVGLLAIPFALLMALSSFFLCGGFIEGGVFENCTDSIVIQNIIIGGGVLVFVYILGGVIGYLFRKRKELV